MDYFKSLLGGNSAQAPTHAGDPDFADYAAAPAPVPISIPGSPADAQGAVPTLLPSQYARGHQVPYTKWYRVWERTSIDDFWTEIYLVPIVLLAVLVHFWGNKKNKSKARKWMAVHQPLLESEFAMVGYSQIPKITPYPQGVQNAGLIEASAKLSAEKLAPDMLKEKSAFDFETYATGRLNIAFADFRIYLWKWYNPLTLVAEQLLGLFFPSMKPLPERMEAIMYAFDGNEANFVAPSVPGTDEIEKPKPIPNSVYDQFIFAIVHKSAMRRLRDERYDLSLTFTKDHAKLPAYATVMSESAEVTDTMLTKEVIAAIEAAGDLFEYLIISDQPMDKPTTLNEAAPKKRLHLCLRLPSDNNYLSTLPLFHAFLRLPDHLSASAHFRPEVKKKINATRDTEKGKLKKVSDKEAEEERTRLADKLRKEERDRKMKGLSAEEQRKFLERENAKDRKKMEKRMTRKG